MTTEKRIEVCIGTDRNGGIRIRLSLLLLDGRDVLKEHFHSGMFMPGDDPVALRASWDAHLSQSDSGIPGAPWPAIPDAEWAKVLGVQPIFHTTEKVVEHRARRSTNKA